MKLQVQIGQEVAIHNNRNFDFSYVVKHITPKRGDITVVRASDGYERKFDAFGREHSQWSQATLHTDVAAARAQQKDAGHRTDAAMALLKIVVSQQIGEGWAKAALIKEADRLQALLDEARSKIDLLSH